MLLQTNSYVVPKDRRVEHARVLRRFRQALQRLGCDHFEVYEQVGANWNAADVTGRYVQIMRFRDRKHQLEVQAAERNDPTTQALLREFCELINFPYQQQQGLFAVGYYTSFLRMPLARTATELGATEPVEQKHAPQHTEEASQPESEQPAGVLSMETSAGEASSQAEADSDAGLEGDGSADPAENAEVEHSDSYTAQVEVSESTAPVLRQIELGPDDTDMAMPFSQVNEIGPEDPQDAENADDANSTSAAVAEDVNGEEEDDQATSHPER